MKIKFAKKEDLKQIAVLSKMFEDEKCCNGIVADDEEYFKDKKVAIVKENNIVVAYAYGFFEEAQNTKSFIKKGEKLFYLEEMYILPEYRQNGLGGKLFEFLEDFAKKNKCNVIECNAVSKDYASLLNFYIQKHNMEFFSAYLYKKL